MIATGPYKSHGLDADGLIRFPGMSPICPHSTAGEYVAILDAHSRGDISWERRMALVPVHVCDACWRRMRRQPRYTAQERQAIFGSAS